MTQRSLLNKLKVSQFEKGIHDDCVINKVDIVDRKGQNGPINKMIYITFAQLDANKKRKAETELSWWKPEAGSEYFKTNLQEMCVQLHNILSCYVGEEEAFEAFEGVFESTGVTNAAEIETKKWKKSEVDALFDLIKTKFYTAIEPFIEETTPMLRVKLTTNFKGEDVEIPKYGKFVEPMSATTSTLKFSDAELKTHSKQGNVAKKSDTANSQKLTI
jgi:hypothetical protein